jgi:hypothetical protein
MTTTHLLTTKSHPLQTQQNSICLFRKLTPEINTEARDKNKFSFWLQEQAPNPTIFIEFFLACMQRTVITFDSFISPLHKKWN